MLYSLLGVQATLLPYWSGLMSDLMSKNWGALALVGESEDTWGSNEDMNWFCFENWNGCTRVGKLLLGDADNWIPATPTEGVNTCPTNWGARGIRVVGVRGRSGSVKLRVKFCWMGCWWCPSVTWVESQCLVISREWLAVGGVSVPPVECIWLLKILARFSGVVEDLRMMFSSSSCLFRSVKPRIWSLICSISSRTANIRWFLTRSFRWNNLLIIIVILLKSNLYMYYVM